MFVCSQGSVIMRWLLDFLENLSSRAPDRTCYGVAWAVDRRLHTAENWVQSQENSVEYLVHVVGTDTRVCQNIFVFPSQLSLPRWFAIRDLYSGPCGGRIYRPIVSAHKEKKPQSFWIFDQQHRSMKCSIISNHICQCNLFSTLLQQS